MLKTIPQYLSAMSDTYGLTKTLGVIDICTKPDGSPDFSIGNNSIIFRIHHNGGEKMLKCYTRNKRNTRRIYGKKCLREELYIHSDHNHGDWVDVVMDDWLDGQTLHSAILKNRDNPAAMKALAESFDVMALELLGKEWAHGDLKPENIIVTPEGEMRLIDFDAMFLPSFIGEQSEECGTTAFQHPYRDINYFDKSIDDYPIALISTALHALSTDPTLAERYDIEEALLFTPQEIIGGTSVAYREVLKLFASECMAVQYRIAKLLQRKIPQLPELRRVLEYATSSSVIAADAESRARLTLENSAGFWGYYIDDNPVIPPIYDSGFEFSEGLAAVCIGGCMHYIDTKGTPILKCPQYEAIKPFRNGKATVIENGIRKEINRNGEVVQNFQNKSR